MGLNTHLPILEPSHWVPGMQFTYMCGPQQFTAHQFCTRTVSECFWLQLTENLRKSCLSYGVFLLYFLLLTFFYNWKYRRKAVNTVIQQHSQGPGFFLSFSSAIFIQTVVGLGSQSCPLTVKCGCSSNTSFAHPAISQGRRGCCSSFIICSIMQKNQL